LINPLEIGGYPLVKYIIIQQQSEIKFKYTYKLALWPNLEHLIVNSRKFECDGGVCTSKDIANMTDFQNQILPDGRLISQSTTTSVLHSQPLTRTASHQGLSGGKQPSAVTEDPRLMGNQPTSLPEIDFENESNFKKHSLQDGGLISQPTTPLVLDSHPPKKVASQ
jgi:hypothetical protein